MASAASLEGQCVVTSGLGLVLVRQLSAVVGQCPVISTQRCSETVPVTQGVGGYTGNTVQWTALKPFHGA